MVRGIRPHVEGGVIRAVAACPCACRPLTATPAVRAMDNRSRNRRIVQVRRIAKRVVLELDNGDAFVIEPRMTGLMLAADPPDREHLRLEWTIAFGRSRRKFWFWDRRGLGTVRLLRASDLHDLEHGGRIGPDPIGLPLASWRALLGRVRRPVKVALLDQSLVGGIGNLYASEILHAARIHPEARTDALTSDELDRLRRAVDAVLLAAIEHEGSTLSDGAYRNVLNQNGGYQNSHRVYDRANEECPTCRAGMVRRIVQAQRSTFYCPECQPRTRRRSARPPAAVGRERSRR